MKEQQFTPICFYFLLFSILMLFGCATPPVLKMPKNLPPIVKEYKHVTISWHRTEYVNTGIYLHEGDFLSIFCDSCHKTFDLNIIVGETHKQILNDYHFNSLSSGYLHFGCYFAGESYSSWNVEDKLLANKYTSTNKQVQKSKNF